MVTIQTAQKQGRVNRYPSHSFALRQNPWVLQPFMIAPVLAGETLKNALMQSRVVSDPLANRLLGWWQEYYYFYVRLRDLEESDTLTALLLDPSTSIAAIDDVTADTKYYHQGTGLNYTKMCLTAVTNAYFRDEGETFLEGTINSMPTCSVSTDQFSNKGSMWLAADYDAPDLDVDLDADTNIMASEVQQAMQQYEFLKNQNMVNMTFEDYLRAFGITPPEGESQIPELIRYIRDWTYPTNTVDPSTGTPSTAASWSITERIDKSRFFKEPGFIFGVTTTRPKIYMENQTGAAVNLLDNSYAWLPAMFSENAQQSLKEIATADVAGSIYPNTSTAFWVDVKDLFLYGDQFVNFALTETDAGLVALPSAGLQRRYASTADMQGLFAGANYDIEQDGVVKLTISGRQTDTTPVGSTVSVTL